MNDKILLWNLRKRMEENLQTGILPFWREYMPDPVHGGFYGRIDGEGKPDQKSPKSVVLNCRILWTLSQAFATFGRKEDQDLALCAKGWDVLGRRSEFWT
ncbi:hypothetical protein D7X87_10790 [bacterium D16-54]|nr:hypothetical protein D7X87_10790 [bacterium D16-54]RKJ14456.1 hypothetical protein D7X65_11385 [bacterium D16-56]